MQQSTIVRRKVIDMAKRRQRPGSGSSLAFLRQRTADMNWIDLTPILGTIKWATVGAVATRHYMPERATKDIDVAIATTDSEAARQKLLAAGFKLKGELSIGGSSWVAPNGQEVDVIEGRESWWRQALAEAQTNRDKQGLPVIPLPYLVLTKFQSSRLQDISDISRMLGQANESDLEAVRQLFKKVSPDDVEDLESLIELGRLEYQEP